MLVLLAEIAGFVVVTWVLSTKLLPPAIIFLRRLLQVPELSFGLLIGGLFLVVVAAEKMGLHGTIGALLFGTALSGLPQRVHRDIMPGMRSAAEGLFVRCSSLRRACSSTCPLPPFPPRRWRRWC